MINSTTEVLSTGDLYFMRPDDVHCYINTTTNFKIINILIPIETFDLLTNYLGEDFRNNLLNSPNPPCHKYSLKEFKSIVTELEQLVLTKKLLRDKSDMFFRITLFNLLTKSFALTRQKSTSNTPEWLRWLSLEMLKKENFTEGLPALYRLSGKSTEHLSRACQKYLKKPPTQLINDIRLEYVINQLMNTNEKIVSICEDAGFDSLSHFYHIFKKSYGISPKNFRKTMQEMYPVQFTSEFVYETKIPDALPFDLLNTNL
jgi:AraC family cel operon transcriptional repressor